MNKEKQHLKDLTVAVCKVLKEADEVMKMDESYDRGRMIAKLINILDLENDTAMHFGLDMSFKKINQMKGRLL